MGKPPPIRGAVLGLVALVATACGIDSSGDGDLTAIADPTSAPEEPAADEPEPEEPAADEPGPEPTAAEPGVDEPAKRLLVYRLEVGEEAGDERTFPVERVVVFDVGAGEERSAFELGGVDNYPVGVGAAGDKLIVATEPRVWVADQEGNEIAVLHDDPGNQVSSLAVSPDGSLAAIALPGFFTDRVGEVVVFDVASGDVVQRLTADDPALADFVGAPGRVQWARPAGGLLAVEGFTYSEEPGSLALLSPDGDVDVLTLGALWPAPDLRHAVRSNVGCLLGSDTVDVVGLHSGAVVTSAGDGPRLLRGVRWAPDSSMVLMELHPEVASEDECITLGDEGWQAVVVDPIASTTTEVDDRAALEAEWDRELGYRVDCPIEPGQAFECVITVDGTEIARGRPPSIDSTVVGFLE